MHAIQFTLKSRNSKVGPLPVSTTSEESCPDACPLKNAGCYAAYGPLAALWRALSDATPGKTFRRGTNVLQSLTWDQFCAAVKALPDGILWRHNQAGDLPGRGDTIDTAALAKLVKANRGKHGFTYTHKPMDSRNARTAVKKANQAGFTINLSADNLREADSLSDLGIGPVVTILPETVQGNVEVRTPAGRRVVVCPATYRDNVSCMSCGLCARADRPTIVGFPAHGAARKATSNIARGV